MSFIHVIRADLEAERPEDPHAAEAEHHLLFQPISLIAPIEVVSDLAVVGPVFRQIGIEQQQGHASAEVALDDVEPCADPDWAILDAYGNLGIDLTGPAGGVPGCGPLDLP